MAASSLAIRIAGARLRWLVPHLLRHYRRSWPAYAVFFLGIYVFQLHFTLGLNASPSVPYTLFLVHKGAPIERGKLMAFRWNGAGPYPAGATFVKYAAGLPGDRVTRQGLAYFVNGTPVGVAKTHTRQGRPLEPAETGVLPSDCYYAYATHPDSFDSRYREVGCIQESRIIGRAYAVF